MATLEENNGLSQCKIGLCISPFTHWQGKTDWHALRLWLLIRNAIFKPFTPSQSEAIKIFRSSPLLPIQHEAHLGFLSSSPTCHSSGETDQSQHNPGKPQAGWAQLKVLSSVLLLAAQQVQKGILLLLVYLFS